MTAIPMLVALALDPAPLASPSFDPTVQSAASAHIPGEGFDYTFVEIELGRTDVDGVDDNVDSFGIGGSYAFAERLFAFTSLATGGNDDVDVTTFELGLGIHFDINPKLDLFGKGSYVHANADPDSGPSVNDDGLDLEAGARFWAAEKLELDGSLEYVDIGGDDETGINLVGRYYFTPQVSGGIRLAFFEDSDGAFLNLRYAF